ncbi:glycosyltransferase family 4 protein [Haloarcula laminariae]|uniref:glycosyltransferase family 4 protein n=1 Tax=Haloarcula laminariae TaxID=2961577 RepID=UPI0024073B98|nr:glycosyltransferase family 4 protein [Halomicroarcula sp. FL173]
MTDRTGHDSTSEPHRNSVLFVSGMDLTGHSGGHIATREIVGAFARHPAVDLSLVCPEPADGGTLPFDESLRERWFLPPKPEDRPGVAGTLRTLGWHGETQLTTAWRLWQAHRAVDPDIVVARVGPSSVTTPVASVLTRTPYAALVRGMVGRNITFGRVAEQVVRLNSLAADDVYVAYEEIKSQVDSYRLGSQSPAVVFPNGVDPELFQPMERERAMAELAIELPPDAFTVGFVGSLKQRHCVAELIRAATTLDDERDVHLLIVGEGPQRAELEDLAVELGIADRVTFTGYVAHDELSPYIARCDAMYGVVDSDNPSNPIKCYEYLACERPVITSNTAELAFVEREQLGVTIDRSEPADIAAAIRTLADKSSGDRAAMGARGRDYVAENHTWDALADIIVRELGD